MVERSQNSYPLLRQFREFYAEIARLRGIAEGNHAAGASGSEAAAGPLTAATASASATIGTALAVDVAGEKSGGAVATAEDADATTIRVWQGTAKYLDQKMYEVNLSASSISHELLRELVYLMAAFADETFVCLVDWPGKEYWRDHLMEIRLFHTQIAGQEIFRRIDKLLARKDYGAEELAAVYLMALALGFKGQYLRTPDSAEAYRMKLFDRLLMTSPELRSDSLRLFPEAYRHTIVEGSPVRLPEPRTWWLVVALIVATWLVLSTIAWFALTGSTRQTLAVTMNSLDRVTNQQMATPAASKWKSLLFYLQNSAFRLELPPTVPLNSVKSTRGDGTFVAPLLIAVNVQNGNAAASPSEVKAWLLRGSTSFLTSANGVPLRSRPVSSVEWMENPPSGMTVGGATLFFLVDPGLDKQELAYHPQLDFPAAAAFGISIAGVTLYLPDEPNAGGQ
jgi:type VI secretion system protein ImpK